jgi:hypothetical protein
VKAMVKMPTAILDGLKIEIGKPAKNRFNDSEYARWSEGITPLNPLATQSGFESFLGTNKSL